VIAVAYMFRGAITLSELLSSAVLFQTAVRFLSRLSGESGPELIQAPTEEEWMLILLAQQSRVV